MTFGLTSWLKSTFPDLHCEVPIWYPAKEHLDNREWLLTNGLGGYSSSTLTGAHTRRYHGLLVSALNPPRDRHIILSRADEELSIGGREFKLASNLWASGVVSPTGFKLIESFTSLPTPTWVYEIDGHYLVKQLSLDWGKDQVQLGYWWLPDVSRSNHEASIRVQFLTGFRYFHDQVVGDSTKHYPQFVSPNHSVILLSTAGRRLHLSWNAGTYQPQNQWWWDYYWPKEAARALNDKEDLFLVGSLHQTLTVGRPFIIGASLDRPIEELDIEKSVSRNIKRQRLLFDRANLPRSQTNDLLVVACDQFLVKDQSRPGETLSVIEGYPWFNDSGRAAVCALSGLALETHRYSEAKEILSSMSARMLNGMLPNRSLDTPEILGSPEAEYGSADISLWWAWSLFNYHSATHDDEFVREQFPHLLEIAQHYTEGTNLGIAVDGKDGLLKCARRNHGFTWMDAKVADIALTPRSGKAVELCALWYNLLETVNHFAKLLNISSSEIETARSIAEQCRNSMQKFWNESSQCLFDVIDTDNSGNGRNDASVRPNQLIALSLPFRTLTPLWEKSVLLTVELQLLTPLAIRSLSPDDPSYQSRYGCGFAHADQYHRDLSYHNGTAWPWLLGHYFAALINVFGTGQQTNAKIKRILDTLTNCLLEESCLGSISEIFDGDLPQSSHGCFAYSLSVAECMRWTSWISRH